MRFIWGHVLIHLLSLAYESLGGLHIYLAPVTTALLGFFWQGIFSSHTFTPALWHGWHLTTVFFYKVHITTPCIFSSAGFSSVSYLESLLRALLRSWGSFGCPMSPTLLEGVTKLPVDFPNCLQAIWLVCTVWSPQESPVLSPGFDHLTAFLAALLWDPACNSVPCDDRGSEILGGTASLRPGK